MGDRSTGPFRLPVMRLVWRRVPALRSYVLMSPALLVMAGALVSPFLLMIGYSFILLDDKGDWTPSLVNYQTFFEKAEYLRVLWRSLGVSSLVAFTTVLLAYPAAYFIAFHARGKKAVWLILVTLPFWTSYLLRVFSWKLILGFNGAINSALVALGIADQPVEFLLYNTFSVITTLAHSWAAFAILPIFVSLQKIDRTLIEAAHDLGEGNLATFIRVTFPLSMPGVVAAILLVFIPTVGDYVTPKLVGGPNSIMIGSIIQMTFGQLDNWPLGAAISISSMLCVAILVCFFLASIEQFKKLVA